MTTGSAIRRFTLDLDDLEWTGHSPAPGLPMSHWR
jgi:hypothetical protein